MDNKIAHYSKVCLIGFFICCLFLSGSNNQTEAAGLLSEWKLPVPFGNYYIVQGDIDSATYTHKSNYPSMKCAIDLVNPRDSNSISGTPLLAPADGKVIDTKRQDLTGNYLTILHDNGLHSQYFHLMDSEFKVEEGTSVKQGQPLALIDHTGFSTEPHLHFVVLNNKRDDCIKLTSLDGNTNFMTGATVSSSNRQLGNAPNPPVSNPISQIPPLSPINQSTISGEACTLERIESYLKGSPLSGLGAVFINKGKQYNVDPRFIIAIASAESSLGRNLCGSYNAWGEMKSGGGGCIDFSSWENAIDYVSGHVGDYYLPKGQNNIPSFVITPAGTCTSHCWCASGCQNWIPNVNAAYQAMGGDPSTNNLTYPGCTGNPTPMVTSTTPATSTPIATYTLPVTATPLIAPNIPSLVEPVHKISLAQNTDITFRWNQSSVASQYYLEYEGGSYGQLNSGWINETAYHIGTMWPGTYRWHVKARNASGMESDWSDIWKFTIQEIATQVVPTLVIPTNTPQPAQDTTKPDGDYSSPSNNASVGCVVHLAAWANDNQSGVKSVHFTAKWNNNWSLVHKDTSSPYEYDWDMCAANVPNGDVELGLDIFDNAGNEFNLHKKHTNIHISKNAPVPTAVPTQPSASGNIAPRANRNPDGSGSSSAFDGNLSTFWVDGLGHAFNLALSWGESLPITRIIIWDRPQDGADNNQINALIITLSNGISNRFGMDSMGARCIDVSLTSPQMINSITLKADDASGNNGLSEVEIWVGGKSGGPTCSNKGSMP
jgi:hypothetical protein